MRLTIAIFFVFLSLTANAANWYVTPSGAGSKNGTTWNQAFAGLPATLTRGDTYFIATGSYSQWVINTPVSGASYVYIRKATATNHGTDTGWNAAYGIGQATVNWGTCVNVGTSYVDIDGVTGSGTSGHGFKFIGSAVGAIEYGIVQVYSGATASHVNLKHCELQGTGQAVDDNHRSDGVFIVSTSCTDWLIQNCYFQGMYVWIATGPTANVIVDHCYLKNAGSSSSWHCAGVTFSGNNFTLRYSVLENMLGYSNTTYVEPQSFPNGIYVYGNVYRATSVNERTTQWANLCTPSDTWIPQNEYFYNNTSYGLHGPPGVSAGNVDGCLVSVVQNNVWQGCDLAPGFQRVTQLDHNVLNTGGVSFVSPATGNFHLSAHTANGVTLASPFNLDPDGTLRGSGGVWDYGAYQLVTTGNPGTISLSAAGYTVSEAGGSITITVTRTGGSSGAASVHYATSNGTATNGVNYTAASGTLNWSNGDSASKTFSVPIINAATYGNPTFNVTLSISVNAALGTPSAAVVTINGVGSPPTPILSGLAWEAEAGQIAAPFVITNGSIVQYVDTQGSPATGGFASYTFTNVAGLYKVKELVRADKTYQNSVSANFNTDPPLDPSQVWDILPVTTNTYEWRYVGWRGSGTSEKPEIPIMTWWLPTGTNTFYMRGREVLTYIDKLAVELVTSNTVVVVSTSTSITNGCYASGTVVPVVISFSNPVNTVNAAMTMNTGGTAVYASGTGTTNITLNYTVLAGQNAQGLDYTATNALTGTVTDGGGNPVDLTLPSPGTIGSISASSAINIDTIAPAVTIGPPSSAKIVTGGTVSYVVTYSDLNPGTVGLSTTLITVNTSGTATGTLSVSVSGPFAFVTFFNCSGKGSLGFTIASGSAVDLAGNLAPGAVSPSFDVNKPNVIFNNVILRNVIVP